jgi:DNA-binding beta-propeller fold protein YncE
VNASLVSGLNHPFGLATSGLNLYVANFESGTISEYTTAGTLENASLISGLSLYGPEDNAVSGSNLFILNFGNFNSGSIGEYTDSGATVNSSLVKGLNAPYGLVVETQATPEPSTWALLLGGLAFLSRLQKRDIRFRRSSPEA